MRDILVVDGHCDALLTFVGKSLVPGETAPRDFFARNDVGHVDALRDQSGLPVDHGVVNFSGTGVSLIVR